MAILIKNGTLVTEADIFQADIKIENESIVALGNLNPSEHDEVIDASGKYIFPGGIDPHTHMELQQSPKYRSVDDFYDGTLAAAMGGTTTILDHIAFSDPGSPLHTSIDRYHELAKKAVIDYGFHGVFQHVDDEILKELDEIVKNQGVTSFKAYSTYGFKIGDEGFYHILKQMKKNGGLLTVHAENDGITNALKEEYIASGKTDPIYHAKSRPNLTESETMARLIQIARMAEDAPLYFVHTSAKESLEVIRDARDAGYENLYCETCTQYLTLTEDALEKDGPIEGLKYTCAPPLRKEADIEALWQALADGTVQTVATDHCPFFFETQKKDGIGNFTQAPGGMPGVEERMRILFSEGVMKGRIDLNTFVKVSSTNAAKIFGLHPKKGSLLPGADADILIMDPNQEDILTVQTQHSKCDYNAFEGMKIKGRVEYVLSRGRVIVDHGLFVGEKAYGHFLHRRVASD